MKVMLLLLASAFTLQLAALPLTHPTASFADVEGLDLLNELPADATELTAADFLTLTPKEYRERTGKKMGLKNAIKLKVAQKALKRQLKKKGKMPAGGEEIPKGLFIVCAVLVPVAAVIFMGLMDDWEGNTWWVAFLLYLLCYVPGLIYTLTKVKNYY